MKKNILILLLAVFTVSINAQNNQKKSDDLGRIVLNTYLSNSAGDVPASSRRTLLNKSFQVASKNGVGGSNSNSRFILTPFVTVIEKEMTPTAPPMTALKIGVTFYVGDGVEGTVFGSETLELSGVGTNETKAFNSALNRINPKDQRLAKLINDSKAKILEYYNANCDIIITEAKALENTQNYDAAMYKLMTVPQTCVECYQKCTDKLEGLYQKSIDKSCETYLNAATNAWNTGLDLSAAEKAGEYLSLIDPNASCYTDAKELSLKISSKIKTDEDKEWDAGMKQQDANIDAQQASIEAMKEIGVAYASKQPQETTYKTEDWNPEDKQ